MELNTPDDLKALEAGLRATYLSGFASEEEPAMELASEQSTTRPEEKHMVVSSTVKMTEWKDQRQSSNFSVFEESAIPLDYQAMVEVMRNDVEDDQIGKYRDVVNDLGRAGRRLWSDLVTEALLAGEALSTYDGQFFFDTDHPVNPAEPGGTTQANLFTARPLTFDNYAYVRMRMQTLRGADGKLINCRPNLLVVGADNEVVARQITESNTQPVTVGVANSTGQIDNVLRGTTRVLVLPEITDGSWYMADVRNARKPFKVFKRKLPVLTSLQDPNSPNVFFQKKFIYGADARGKCVPSHWHFIGKAKP
jgi:phage major head subunit gpT-like protein